jgi:hypothetical protein
MSDLTAMQVEVLSNQTINALNEYRKEEEP